MNAYSNYVIATGTHMYLRLKSGDGLGFAWTHQIWDALQIRTIGAARQWLDILKIYHEQQEYNNIDFHIIEVSHNITSSEVE